MIETPAIPDPKHFHIFFMLLTEKLGVLSFLKGDKPFAVPLLSILYELSVYIFPMAWHKS